MIHILTPYEPHMLTVKQFRSIPAELNNEEAALGIADIDKNNNTRIDSFYFIYFGVGIFGCDAQPIIDQHYLRGVQHYLSTTLDDLAFVVCHIGWNSYDVAERSETVAEYNFVYLAHQGQ
jgi:hypothetical protein